jgi:hypothetical protein
MIIRTLIREYDYPENVVNITTGSNILQGTGTKFSLLKIGSLVEIDSYGFAGRVISIESDNQLTLDRALDSTLENKNWWIDITGYLLQISGRSRKVESDNAGEAGAITFDNLELQYYFGEGLTHDNTFIENPVPSFFNNISSSKRLLIKLKVATWDFNPEGVFVVTNNYEQLVNEAALSLLVNYKTNQVRQIYEGVIDFSAITYPSYPDGESEFYNSVKFRVFDKLSAISLLSNILPRQHDLLSPLLTGATIDRIEFLKHWDNTSFSFKYLKAGTSSSYSPQITDDNNTPNLGDILQMNMLHTQEEDSDKFALLTFKYLKVVSLIDPTLNRVYYDCITNELDYFQGTTSQNKSGNPSPLIRNAALKWYNNLFYNEDIYIKQWNNNKSLRGPSGPYETGFINVAGYEIVALDGIKILKAIIKQVWNDVKVVNKLYDKNGELITEFRLPLNYIFQLLDEKLFGKEILDALIFLSNSMNCYLYFNQESELVLQNVQSLDDSNPSLDKAIPVELLSKMEKEEFWDKLIDAAEVKVNSWIKESEDGQDYLTGEGYAYKRQGIKPRNQQTSEVFIDVNSLLDLGITVNEDGSLNDPTVENNDQSAILNRIADYKAATRIDFYGKRHISYNLTFCKMTSQMLDWDMLTTFTFIKQKCFEGDKNNGRYFIQKLDFNDAANTVDIKLVSISRIDYDESQVLIGTKPDNTQKVIIKSSNDSSYIPSKTIYANYQIKKTDGIIYCNASGNDISIELPNVSNKNAEYLLKRIDRSFNKIVINGALGSYSNPELAYAGHEIRFKSNGYHWVVLNDVNEVRLTTKLITEDYTVKLTDKMLLCDASTQDITISFPELEGSKDYEVLIRKVDNSEHKVILQATIDNLNNPEMYYCNEEKRVKSNGALWQTINNIDLHRSSRVDISSDYTLKLGDKAIYVDATSGNINLFLPTPALAKNYEFYITKTDSSDNEVIINEMLNGVSFPTLSCRNQDFIIRSDGAQWCFVNGYSTFTIITESPLDNRTPAYIHERIYDKTRKVWWQAKGSGKSDWARITNSEKKYTEGNNPNGRVTPDYIGQPCNVLFNNKSEVWYSKSLLDNSWHKYIGYEGNDVVIEPLAADGKVIIRKPGGDPTKVLQISFEGDLYKIVSDGLKVKNLKDEEGNIIAAIELADYEDRQPGDMFYLGESGKYKRLAAQDGYLKHTGGQYVFSEGTGDTGDVYWTDVKDRPDKLSEFTNDTNYISSEFLIANSYIRQGSTPETSYLTEALANSTYAPAASLNGLASEEWVNAQGYLKNADFSNYALKSDVSSLQQWANSNFAALDSIQTLASEEWVNAQYYIKQGTTPETHYLTEKQTSDAFVKVADIAGYPKTEWVLSQGFLKQGTTPETQYPTVQYVNNTFVTPDLLTGLATEYWVNQQGYIKQGNTPETTYVTASYVNANFVTPDLLTGLATEYWVNQQGFIKQGSTPETTYVTAWYVNYHFVTPDLLEGVAYQSWVNSQNFLKQGSTPEAQYPTVQYVNNTFVTPDLLNGVAYQSWVNSQNFLKQGSTPETQYPTVQYVNNTFVTPDLLTGLATEYWVSQQGFIKQGNTPETTYVTASYVNANFVTPDLLTGLATEYWVNQQGFIKQGNTPETTYVTASYVNTNFVTPDLLTGLATEYWVSQQCFLKQGITPETQYPTVHYVNNTFVTPDLLNGVAYQSWVNSQNFIKQGTTPETTFVTAQYVNSNFVTPDLLNGVAYQSWVNSQNFLKQGSTPEAQYPTVQYVNNTFVTPDLLSGVAYQNWVNSQNFLKQGSTPETQYPTVQYVNNTFVTPDLLEGVAYQNWVNQQSFLKQGITPETQYPTVQYVNNTFVTPDLLEGVAYQNWVNQQGFLKQGITPETQYPTVQYVNNTFVTPDLLSGVAYQNWVISNYSNKTHQHSDFSGTISFYSTDGALIDLNIENGITSFLITQKI